MKASTLVVQGALAALAGMTAAVQAQPPAATDLRLSAKTPAPSPPDIARAHGAGPPAPRGDLRSDIASNAHARPDNERDERPPHH
ncbi:hypothetical protein [Caballeronia sp. Lep1P3]|uniref:hypothetical protein n=1 Tax=Caballeronia sp. Lep1P3 TaxID=2878150 RepID=UPI001FD57079|nr:hypothetical protein [Caballeronia sp. Lep1P3]